MRQKRNIGMSAAARVAGLLWLGWGPAFGEETVDFKGQIQPVLAMYCVDCHGQDNPKADLNLKQFLEQPDVLKNRRTWERVLEMVVEREMPPDNKPQPSEADRLRLTQFITTEFDRFDCDETISPGKVTLRRLNRNEYNNTIRDLIGLDVKPADDFPDDEVGYGFDNIGDVLSLSPLLLEKYLDAAEGILNEALVLHAPEWPPRLRFEGEEAFLSQSGNDIRPAGKALGMYRDGHAVMEYAVQTPGEYRFAIRAYGDQAGPEPAKMAVTLNGEAIETFSIKAESRKPEAVEFQRALEQGPVRLEVAYTNNYVVQDDPNPELIGDRNLFVDYVEVAGPIGSDPPPLPAAHTRIIPRPAESGQEKLYAREVIQGFASLAFRRPATSKELDDLCALFEMVWTDGANFEESIHVALQAVLVSPHFLYRWELQPPEQEQTVHRLDDYQLASRLSYFLWSSMPDERLFDLAREGRLSQAEVVEQEVLRMIQDPKAQALVQNFAGQWLQIRNLDSMTPDKERFPQFNDDLRHAMRMETELFFEGLMKEDRSVLELLDADYTFLNETLARHYGIDGIQGDQFRKVALTPDSHRGGVLTHASILTITSNPTRTSPVIRGKWILEQILGTPPPPPPPNVPELEEGDQALKLASLRQRLEQHRANPDCATCHNKMDPIGFAFENYDAIGAWRELDGNFPIDPSGELPTGERFEGADDLKEILKTRDSFVRALVENMLTFALGRGLEYYDDCAVDRIIDRMNANGLRFSPLLLGIVNSKPFQLRQAQTE